MKSKKAKNLVFFKLFQKISSLKDLKNDNKKLITKNISSKKEFFISTFLLILAKILKTML
jgi:hypothetical protein